jgi:hypothetical protein
MNHTFHIPVLGLAYSVDTPAKVAKYGISSVASIVDDTLAERMRQFYTEKNQQHFIPIKKSEPDFRAKRITAYLNLLQEIVDRQVEELRNESFGDGAEINKYFELLPKQSSLKQLYEQLPATVDAKERKALETLLRERIVPGAIDVNIMAKVDRMSADADGNMLIDDNSDALSALRGFAHSNLNSSVVLSAGMNPRLYSYLESFKDFYPDEAQQLKKKIILKVSDFRSAFIQAKFLAKKGLWVSEFRIESGLNCGGHAFATEGILLGPILEEFKNKKAEMVQEIGGMYQAALATKNISIQHLPEVKLSVQGGIGTAEENEFLLKHYDLDATGWGSPFLLVPEATNVDEQTLKDLVQSGKEDFYISGSSPLGVPFNNFSKSSSEKVRLERIARNRPGSPCTKKYLVSNTEFTKEPICTASREYQKLKIEELEAKNLEPEVFKEKFNEITEKICLCEGLVTSAYIKDELLKPKESKAVVICPGPNTAYFKGIFTLEEMVKHIYGQVNLLADTQRSNIFINELNLYVDYLKKDIVLNLREFSEKKVKYFSRFKSQLQEGIFYYKQLVPQLYNQSERYKNQMLSELKELEARLALIPA